MFCCDWIFLFPHSLYLSFNKLDSEYSSYLVNSLKLMKPYYFMTFVNVGNGITGIGPMLINFMMSDGCLKFASTWVVIDSLNSMNWTLSIFSVSDINTSKLSSDTVKLLLWCWIYCLFLPLFFWSFPLVWRWLYPFTWLVSLPPWFGFTWSFPNSVGAWIFVCVSLFAPMGFIFLYWPH